MRFVAVLVTFFSLLFAASCSEPMQPTLEVSPASTTLVSGKNTQLTVTRRFPGGQADDVTNKVTYSSSNKSVLGVDARGLLIPGTEGGTAVIRVSDPQSDAFALATFTVVPPRIEAIDIIPSPAIVMKPAEIRQFTATARFNDGVNRDVTGQMQWTSSNEAAARVGTTAGFDNGRVTAVTEGDAIIIARDAETGIEGRTTVFVRGAGPQLLAITLTPNPASVPVSGTVQFTALGIFSDGSSTSVTNTVAWSSSNEAVLKVDQAGLATGVASGMATVTVRRIELGIVASAEAKVQ